MVTLVFVAVLVVTFALDLWVIRPWERRHLVRTADASDAPLELTVPRNLFFHPGHTWVRLDTDGNLTVGIDDFARVLLGDLSTVELPAVGKFLTAGQPALAIRQGQRRLQFAAPVSGTVTAINSALGRDPIRLRWRPYKEGWAYRVAAADRLSIELADLVVGQGAERWISAELDHLEHLFASGLLAPPLEGSVQRANDQSWALFEQEVLRMGGRPEELPA